MQFSFDINGRYEYPIIILGNPDRSERYIIEYTKDLKITPRFNAVSEMSFTVYKNYNDVELPYYGELLKNKLLHVLGFGWFIIDTTDEVADGGVPYKNIHALSYEYTLNYKGVNLLNGTYKFYDLLNPSDSLLGKVTSVLPNWKIGHVDSELLNLYRTFDIPDTTLYGFLMNEVSTTYEVIFEFDTENLIINAYAPKNSTKTTDIMFTFDNVIKNINISEVSTDIYTVLRVNGADNLSINVVNPLGDNRLYNLNYYKNDIWLQDKDLIERINQWEELVEANREPYNNLLNQLNSENRDLLKLKTELVDLKNELSALEIVRKNLINQPEEFKKKTDEVDAKNIEIRNKEQEIVDKEAEIENTKESLAAINNLVKYSVYFTKEEQIKLDPYIIESVYSDENFIVTDTMKLSDGANGDSLVLTTTGTKKVKDLTDTDIIIDEQYIANQLLEQGKKVLEKVSQPSFTFSMDSTNFLFVEKFLPFIKQIDLGAIINVEVSENNWVYPILLEMSIDYDNPTSFSMTFGNRFRLSDEEWTFADLHNEQQKTSAQVGSTLAVASEPVLNGSISRMDEYMNNSLIAANQEIQSTVDNEVSRGSYGLRCKKKNDDYPTGFEPQQLWLNDNLICMTDDNWQTVKLAIGQISFNNQEYYGVNGELIAGRLIAGNQLIIQDGTAEAPSTFIVDANGCRLTNASFVLDTLDNKGKIVLNPNDGISIQTNKNNTGFEKVFYVDTDGNLIASDITAVGGTIGGITIEEDQLTWRNNNYIKGDGSIKLGGLTVTSNGDATFEGEITADSGSIGGFEITSNSITNGTNITLNSNGTGQLGLLTWTTRTATFDGNIYARNLQAGEEYGWIGDRHIQTDTISGDKIGTNSFQYNRVNDQFATGVYEDFIAANYLFVNKDGYFGGTLSWGLGDDDIIRGTLDVYNNAVALRAQVGNLYLGSKNNITLNSALVSCSSKMQTDGYTMNNSAGTVEPSTVFTTADGKTIYVNGGIIVAIDE